MEGILRVGVAGALGRLGRVACAAIEAADSDPSVQAVLIVGAGRNFIAGADIREFGKPPVPPSLPVGISRWPTASGWAAG